MKDIKKLLKNYYANSEDLIKLEKEKEKVLLKIIDVKKKLK